MLHTDPSQNGHDGVGLNTKKNLNYIYMYMHSNFKLSRSKNYRIYLGDDHLILRRAWQLLEKNILAWIVCSKKILKLKKTLKSCL